MPIDNQLITHSRNSDVDYRAKNVIAEYTSQVYWECCGADNSVVGEGNADLRKELEKILNDPSAVLEKPLEDAREQRRTTAVPLQDIDVVIIREQFRSNKAVQRWAQFIDGIVDHMGANYPPTANTYEVALVQEIDKLGGFATFETMIREKTIVTYRFIADLYLSEEDLRFYGVKGGTIPSAEEARARLNDHKKFTDNVVAHYLSVHKKRRTNASPATPTNPAS